MRNFYITYKPYVGTNDYYGVQSVSSQQATYAPASNSISIYEPKLSWRTTGAVTDQWITIDLQTVSPANVALKGLHISRINFPELKVYGSAHGDGTVFHEVTPNIIKWNNLFNTSPWASSGSLTITPSMPGPGTNLVGQRVQFGSGSVLYQDLTFGTNAETQSKDFSFHVWLRAPLANSGVTISIITNSVQTSKAASLGRNWSRVELKGTTAGSATSPVRVRIEAQAGGATLDVWGANFCWGTDSPVTTYETNAKGIVIPKHEDTDRRQGYIDLPYFNYRYVRILIPGGQTTDDASSYYSVGNLLPLHNLIKMWGGLQVPRPVSVFRGFSRLDLEGGSAEYSDYGDNRITVEMSGTWRTALQRSNLAGMFAKNKQGTAIHMFENLNYPECPEEIIDISKSYITRLVSQYASTYNLVELYDQTFTFEEIV